LENKFLDKITTSLSDEFPVAETLDRYLDAIIPKIRSWGEDLYEEHFYLGKPWMEMRDDENFHTAVLHFFNEGGEYLKSVDGDISSGSWRYMEGSNKFLIGEGGRDGELYDLAFLDGQFFILSKHGDQERMGQRKYFVMVIEPVAKSLEWRHAMEMLFNKYRNNNSFFMIIMLIILVIVAIFFILY
jgi:hypothetical protein